MKIQKLTNRDRELLIHIMEIVADEMAATSHRSDMLYNIKKRVAKEWVGADAQAVFDAMERGWDSGKGWHRVKPKGV